MKKIIDKIKREGILITCLFIVFSIFNIILKKIIFFACKYKKLKNIFIFYSLPDYSDNAKELFLYYKNSPKYLNYKFIWFVEDITIFKNNNEERVKFVKAKSKWYSGKSISAYYYGNIAKCMFYTHMSPIESNSSYKRKEQLIINLWHGCGYKNVEKKSDNSNNVTFDYVLVPGPIFVKTKSKFFGCSEKQILDIGYPRYDLLFKENINTQNYVKKIKNNFKNLIVWMPTFRKTINGDFPEENIKKQFDLPIFNSIDELIKINDVCNKNNVVLCIKRHPFQKKYDCECLSFSNIIFIDNYDLKSNDIDLYSFIKYTDALITDYSSVAIDYLLLDNPIAFTLDDFDEYSRTRGFVFDNPKKYMPGFHIYNYNDFENFIINYKDNKNFLKEKLTILGEIHNNTNNYCERLAKKIEILMEGKTNE